MRQSTSQPQKKKKKKKEEEEEGDEANREICHPLFPREREQENVTKIIREREREKARNRQRVKRHVMEVESDKNM